MSLYVRVLNSFYTHRKTIRLRAAIGDAAYWVPPRLWAYASENQPDGCLQQYTSQELSMLIAYQGDGKALLGALLQAGFLDADPIRIHDWQEHNGYHASYADRAKKAAAARWSKAPPAPPQERKGYVPDPSIASSTATSIQRLHGIPASVDDVIRYGRTIMPPVSEEQCRAFFSHYEGQARTNQNGQVFWVTSADTVITNWKVKLPEFRRSFTSSGNSPGGQPRKRPPRSHVDAVWNEAEWKWV